MSPALRRRLSRPGVIRKVNPVTGFMESIDQKTGETLYVDDSQEYALNEGFMWGADQTSSVDYSSLGGGGGRGSARIDDKVLRAQEKALKEKYPGTNIVFNSRKMRWEDPVAEAAYEAKLDKYIEEKRKLQAEIQKKKNASKPKYRKVWTPFGDKYIPIVSEAYAAISNEIGNLQEAIKNLEIPTMPTYDDIVSQLPTMDEVKKQISESTPDIKIDPQDAIDDISDATPDIKITDTSTGDIVKQIDETYQGSDVDSFLEDTQETGEFMLDVVKTIVTGKPEGKVEDAQNELTNTQTTLQETGENIQTGLDNLEDVATDTVGTTNEVLTDIGTNVSEQFSEAMGLTDETQGGAVTEGTRGGDVVRDEDLIQLGKKKSDLRAKKKRGKKGLRIDYGVNVPGVGKSGIAA